MELGAVPRNEQAKSSLPTTPLFNEHLPHNTMVERFRKIVIVLLGIKIILSTSFFGFKMYHLVEYTSYSSFVRTSSVTASLVIGMVLASIIIAFFIFFLIYVVRYDSAAIHVCTWLTIFDLVFIALSLVFAMQLPISASLIAHSLVTATVVILSLLSLFTTIFIIIFGFQLLNAIKLQEGYHRI